MPHARPVPASPAGFGLRLLGGLLATLMAAAAAAETLYITDNLRLGLHESRERTSAIIQLLPSATELEVLERDGGFVRVRAPDGAEGWVDAAYLTADLPARLEVAELQSWKATREEELKAAWAEVETLRAELALASGTEVPDTATPPRQDYLQAMERIARLEDDNAALRELLARQAEEAAAQAPADMPREATAAPSWLPAWGPEWALRGLLIVAGVLFIGGLTAGLWLMDRINRRRHGGFRV
ncbi:MAG: TIGR04211 family SH3 domain-containing protein [Gammaproteobacteria bacterium]|nr:TIGR04211 family SH3 domain-containing protein [Gammaproteobacteria bacterium]